MSSVDASRAEACDSVEICITAVTFLLHHTEERVLEFGIFLGGSGDILSRLHHRPPDRSFQTLVNPGVTLVARFNKHSRRRQQQRGRGGAATTSKPSPALLVWHTAQDLLIHVKVKANHICMEGGRADTPTSERAQSHAFEFERVLLLKFQNLLGRRGRN